MHQKKSISIIMFIHQRKGNHRMNFIQHIKKNVLYYHFRTTSRLYYSTTLRLKNAEIFFPLPSFDSAQDDKGEKNSNKEIKQAPFRVGGNLFYFKYSNIYLVSRINNSTPTEFRNFSFPSLPSTPLRMTKVEKFLSLSVLNSWILISHISHAGVLISSTLRLHNFTTLRLHDFTTLQFHKFTTSQLTLDTQLCYI